MLNTLESTRRSQIMWASSTTAYQEDLAECNINAKCKIKINCTRQAGWFCRAHTDFTFSCWRISHKEEDLGAKLLLLLNNNLRSRDFLKTFERMLLLSKLSFYAFNIEFSFPLRITRPFWKARNSTDDSFENTTSHTTRQYLCGITPLESWN